jgi:hypothetical protein
MKPGDRVLIAETNAFAHVIESCKVEDLPELAGSDDALRLGLLDVQPVEQVKSNLRKRRVTWVILLEYWDGSCEPVFQLADTSFCNARKKKLTIIPLLPEVVAISKKRGKV